MSVTVPFITFTVPTVKDGKHAEFEEFKVLGESSQVIDGMMASMAD